MLAMYIVQAPIIQRIFDNALTREQSIQIKTILSRGLKNQSSLTQQSKNSKKDKYTSLQGKQSRGFSFIPRL